MFDEFITVAEAATHLGMRPSGVRALERRGLLQSSRTPGNHRRFRLADVHQIRRRKDLKTDPRQRIPSEDQVRRDKRTGSAWLW